MRTILFITFLSTFLFSEVDIKLSHKNVKNGTTFAVIFQSDIKMTQAPYAIFLDKTYQMFTINGSIKKYELFLPVDYHSKKQKQSLVVKYLEDKKLKQKKLFINIIDGNYRKNEIIKVSKGKVFLSNQNKKRAKAEYSKVYAKVYSKVTPYQLTKQKTFQKPINTKITSAFGNARIYNGKTKSYHSGTDFRAKVGTKIKASNNGKVVLVMDRFYLGKVIYIDHGRGAYSYYSHMDKSFVKEGENVKKGEVIGASGKSGRVTAAHLHYALRLYNVTVDPLQYHQLYDKVLALYH